MSVAVQRPPIIEDLGGEVTEAMIDDLLGRLTEEEMTALYYSWERWRLPYQVWPAGEWRTWVMRCGRGTGKTMTGAATVNELAMDRKRLGRGDIAVAAPTWQLTRDALIEGQTGILATASPSQRPRWEPGKHLLTWPNGVRGFALSGEEPRHFRSKNLAFVWADELDHWPTPLKTWDEAIEFALRRGIARALVTTTPKPGGATRELEQRHGTITTRASTFANPYLPEKVREFYRRLFSGTRVGRQEADGEHLNLGLLWDIDVIAQHRVSAVPSASDLVRVVVAVDPSGTDDRQNDAQGIAVAGVDGNGHYYVMAAYELHEKPDRWAADAVAQYRRTRAETVVAETNFGGDMVVSTIHAVDRAVQVKKIRASRGKWLRAEPVAALYEQGRVHHVGELQLLEDQQITFGPDGRSSGKSPNALDAAVFALTELALPQHADRTDMAGYLEFYRQ